MRVKRAANEGKSFGIRGRPCILSQQQEEELVQWIIECAGNNNAQTFDEVSAQVRHD